MCFLDQAASLKPVNRACSGPKSSYQLLWLWQYSAAVKVKGPAFQAISPTTAPSFATALRRIGEPHRSSDSYVALKSHLKTSRLAGSPHVLLATEQSTAAQKSIGKPHLRQMPNTWPRASGGYTTSRRRRTRPREDSLYTSPEMVVCLLLGRIEIDDLFDDPHGFRHLTRLFKHLQRAPHHGLLLPRPWRLQKHRPPRHLRPPRRWPASESSVRRAPRRAACRGSAPAGPRGRVSIGMELVRPGKV